MKKNYGLIALLCISRTVLSVPASFPCASTDFTKVVAGTLSVTGAQQRPWYESYTALYKTVQSTQLPDTTIVTMLTQLQQQSLSPSAAALQLQSLQQSLIASAQSLTS